MKWFENYLVGTKQRVIINGESSQWAEVRSGVPQGSILGPILFIVYINDMPDPINYSKLTMFTDDSKCNKTVGKISDSVALKKI